MQNQELLDLIRNNSIKYEIKRGDRHEDGELYSEYDENKSDKEGVTYIIDLYINITLPSFYVLNGKIDVVNNKVLLNAYINDTNKTLSDIYIGTEAGKDEEKIKGPLKDGNYLFNNRAETLELHVPAFIIEEIKSEIKQKYNLQ